METSIREVPGATAAYERHETTANGEERSRKEALVTLDHVSRSFQDDPPLRPVEDVSLTVRSGDLVIISGDSGCGKTTLLNLIGGLLRPDSGTILYGGVDARTFDEGATDRLHRDGLGFIFQEPFLLQALTVRENLLFVYRIAKTRPDERAIEAMLDLLGLDGHADHLPSQLSLGQRRRLVVARTLLAKPSILMADEPTNDLDARWADLVVNLLARHTQEPGCCTIMVTHDPRYIGRSPLAYHMEAGKLVAVGDRR